MAPAKEEAEAELPLRLRFTHALGELETSSEVPTPVFVKALEIRGVTDQYVEAEGEVELRKQGLAATARKMRYEPPTGELVAEGDVRIQTPDAVVRGPSLRYNLESASGHMEAPRYVLAAQHARGEAARAEFLDKERMRLSSASYTTCGPGQDDWFIRAGSLYLDRSTQEGVARNARVEFMGVPLLYTPWISFPLSRERKSGFLAPSFGTTVTSGAELTLPYYWNIAPNYDATLFPRYMQKRGLQLGGEFRYLDPAYAGRLEAEYLDDRALGETRTAFKLAHQQQLPFGVTGSLNVQRVSDDNYFRDLATNLAQTAQTVLPQEWVLSFAQGGLSLLGRVQRFQVLQDPKAPVVAPYARRPQLGLSYAKLDWLGADFRLAGEFTDFASTSLVEGRRVFLYPSIALPLARSWGYLTPKLGVHYTHYSLGADTLGRPDATGTLRPYDASATRVLPILSLDGGLTFERQTALFGRMFTQTLEPRLYYLYVPYKDQSRLPSFDTAEADFNFAQIFSENRFVGQDRIGDANQLTLALASRYLDPVTGEEWLRATIGQRLTFKAPQVTLINAAPKDRRSNFLAALGGRIVPGLTAEGAWEYDPNRRQTVRTSIGGRYMPEVGKVVNLAYHFNRDSLRQVDASAQWPLAPQWSGLARWNYSLRDRRLIEGIAGVEYSKGCWALRLVTHRFVTATQQTSTGVFVQLELSGISHIGSNPLALLRQSIPGFAPSEPRLTPYSLDDF